MYDLTIADLARLGGKTVIVTGGATGIGRAVVRLLHERNANIVLADWNEDEAKALVSELKNPESIVVIKTNVAAWNDVLAAFELGFSKFGTVDAAISNAGVNWGESLLDFDVDEHTQQLGPPSLDSLNINLIAHLYVVRCAVYYFRKYRKSVGNIVLTTSAAAFLDTPPLYMYSTAKSGLLGLMRSLRTTLAKENITINTIAPWMTMSPMVPRALVDLWGDLPANTAEGVAKALVLPICKTDTNGKIFFVAGNEIVELEDSIIANEHRWFGENLKSKIDEGQRRLLGDSPF